MTKRVPFELLDDPRELASYQGWSEEVYADLLALKNDRMSNDDFDRKYLTTKAILVLDLTGFTENAIRGGSLRSFLRILDAHRLILPVLRECKAEFIRTFADDIVALFRNPADALDAALLIQSRNAAAIDLMTDPENRPECCIGIGFGPVYRIGPDRAMGDAMNRASKLGEEIARGGETLVTEAAYLVLRSRGDVEFRRQDSDDQLFPYYQVIVR